MCAERLDDTRGFGTRLVRDGDEAARTRAAVTYVAGMTDRFAFEAATALLGWNPDRLPKGIGRGA